MADRAMPRAGQVISGTHGFLWFDGNIAYEVSNFEAKIETDREDVTFSGQMTKDSKLMGVSGTWSATVRKIYSRSKDIAESIMQGKDPRSTLIGKLADPDNGGTERVQFSNCWFDEVTLMAFENGSICEDELSGGFTAFKYLDSINDPCI